MVLIPVLTLTLIDVAVADLDFPVVWPFSASKLLDEGYTSMSAELTETAHVELS